MLMGHDPPESANEFPVHGTLESRDGGPHRPRFPVGGIEEVWAETRGDDRVLVAVLDGPVDLAHPTLRGANLRPLDGLVSARPDDGAATRHGTRIARVIFGRPDDPSPGIAPGCSGVAIPIFDSAADGSIRSCSQLDLAQALTRAAVAGARVINVSGGQFSPGGAAHPLLAEVVRDCARQGVLIVAAAGNDGCECLHVPAALDPVLVVGALDACGEPSGFSNWGAAYRDRGVLAPGFGPGPGGGTSYATAVVSGVAALLISLQLRRGQRPDPARVREAILAGARTAGSRLLRDKDARYLAGPLAVREAVSFLTNQGRHSMAENDEVQASDVPASRAFAAAPTTAASVPTAGTEQRAEAAATADSKPAEKPAEKPAGCGCGAAATRPSLVYALGQLGYDFRSEARLDSVVQKMAAEARVAFPDRALAHDPRRFLTYLESNPWDAAAVEWTLSVDGTTLYAIRPAGPFAADGYRLLQRFLKEQIAEGVERVSVPGVLAGKATLLNGQTVPALVPDMRGMYSWTTAALVDAVAGKAPRNGAAADRNGHHQKREGVHNFLTRLYHEVRNLGQTPQHRALNYAATNAFAAGEIYTAAIKEKMELDRVEVVPSPLGRPGSECWDVEVYFFYPERQVQTVRKVYRFTVDVSDNVPVSVGTMRSWFIR
jgi:cyanobactin maturation PatA/PatG family protease